MATPLRGTPTPARRSPLLLLHAVTIIAFFSGSSATTPLFPLYQAAWGISSFMVSVIFAIYVLALLVSFLFFGTLSNRYGRRPVILMALAVEILSMIAFLVAQGETGLIVARLVQGFASGVATTAVAAALMDVDHKSGATINSLSPMLGMAFGALSAGALVEFAPLPLRLVYWIYLAIFVVQFVLTCVSRETYLHRSHGGWRATPRIEIPLTARGTFVRVLPINAAVWGLGALFLSLLPPLFHAIAPEGQSTAYSSIAVGVLTLTGAAAVAGLRNHPTRRILTLASVAVVVGTGLILMGSGLGIPALIVVGALPAGLGFGAGFLGVLNSITAQVEPHERAGLISAFYIASYLPNAVLAMIAGYVAQRIGVVTTSVTFCGLILCLVALSALLLSRRQNRFGSTY